MNAVYDKHIYKFIYIKIAITFLNNKPVFFGPLHTTLSFLDLVKNPIERTPKDFDSSV